MQKRPRAILARYRSYAGVFAEIFSFVFLLRTLFAPWKNIKDAYPNRGLQLSRILETLTFNIVTRTIGAVIRLGTIVIGLFIQAGLLAGFVGYLALWFAFPILLPFGLLLIFGFL